ncbi:hypothetical protein M3Y98_01044900 [Aphelenchoides besseyi]|nr:hypothetical protein M3Y98_01044900 [Aphelenchoides besseyi]KAI6209841.1 hypothetical protein M3Y96_00263900 [Aphelenchoides besseyi]
MASQVAATGRPIRKTAKMQMADKTKKQLRDYTQSLLVLLDFEKIDREAFDLLIDVQELFCEYLVVRLVKAKKNTKNSLELVDFMKLIANDEMFFFARSDALYGNGMAFSAA